MCRIDQGPTSQTTEAETYGRVNPGNGSREGWDERALGEEVAEWPVAVGDETGSLVAHPARSLRRGVGRGVEPLLRDDTKGKLKAHCLKSNITEVRSNQSSWRTQPRNPR